MLDCLCMSRAEKYAFKKSGESDGWVTKLEAAKALGNVNPKTVERMAKAGKIGHKLQKRFPGGRVIAVYKSEDVERVSARRQAVLSVDHPAFQLGESAPRRSRPPTASEVLTQIAKALSLPRASEKLLLNMQEAVAFSALPEFQIEAALRSGMIKAVNYGGSELIRRADLIAFVDQLVPK